MSTIEEELRIFVLADVAVSGLISDRFYPVQAQQEPTLPFAVYQKVSGSRISHHSLASATAQLASPRFQITAMAKTYGEAKTLINAIRDRLHGRKEMFGTVQVEGIFIINEIDGYEPDTEESIISMDLEIWHLE